MYLILNYNALNVFLFFNVQLNQVEIRKNFILEKYFRVENKSYDLDNGILII